MKKIHKILVITMIVIALVVVAVLPSGVAFADQTCKTNKVSFYSLDEENYPLKNGFVISTHMNGPVYFEKKEFQLHGARPDTQFFIYREFPENIYIPGTDIVAIPAGTQLYSGDSFWTDKHGNGHITTSLPPWADNFILCKFYGIDHLTLKNVLFDGLLVKDGGSGGVAAYESETLVTYLDFRWTPDLVLPTP
ncbi:hypothetical protein ACFLXY_06115 [Chloroflexota bacterium]